METILLIEIVNKTQSTEKNVNFKVQDVILNRYHWIEFHFVKTHALSLLLWIK